MPASYTTSTPAALSWVAAAFGSVEGAMTAIGRLLA